MQIVNVEKRERYYWRVTFGRDGEEIAKWVRLGDCQRRVLPPNQYPIQFMLNVQRAAREADRDIAFRHHGDKFRDHCEFKSKFWEFLPEQELAKLY